MKEIVVSGVKSDLFVELRSLYEVQGDLKELESESLEKLKSSIVSLGFIAPFFVWLDDGRYNIVDGHQRKIALMSLQADGYKIPRLPCVQLFAESYDDARKKILAISSQYGDPSPENVSQWIDELGDDIGSTIRMVATEISLDLDLNLGTGFDDEDEPEKRGEGKIKTCPECGCQF